MEYRLCFKNGNFHEMYRATAISSWNFIFVKLNKLQYYKFYVYQTTRCRPASCYLPLYIFGRMKETIRGLLWKVAGAE